MDNGEYFVYIKPSEKMEEYLLKRNPTVDFSSDSTRVKIYFTVKNTIIAQLKIIVRRYEKGLYDGIPLITLYESVEEAIEKDIEKKVLHAEEYFFEHHPE